MDDGRRRLIRWGMLLFLLGLFTGFAEPEFANIRMGLAAHLEGVMNGIFLIAVAAVWTEIKLAPRLKTAAFWAALCGTYGNFAVTSLAAALGTAALSPITGAGHMGLVWQENLVTGGFAVVGVLIVSFSLLALWGLRPQIT